MSRHWVLPIIVIAEFACSSIWFAGNAVIMDLPGLDHQAGIAEGSLTSSVQFGFIVGTLIYAILTIADRNSPSKVFLFSAFAGGILNFALILPDLPFEGILVCRFATGVFLAGIYPVGMKIAADYYERGLGLALGFLVGALDLGTAFPHLVKSVSSGLPWEWVIYTTSGLAILGGLLIGLLVPDGPYRNPGRKPNFKAFLTVFKNPDFRAASFGYFGHMWELYTLWAFVPFILMSRITVFPEVMLDVPFWSFVIIGSGGIACVLGGYLSERIGSKWTAFGSLSLSGLCCVALFPMLFVGSTPIFLAFMVFWGMVVVADSPQFSTLVAGSADPQVKGTALTIVNSIGFAITIVSIQVFSLLMEHFPLVGYFALVPGPLFGLISLSFYGKEKEQKA